MMTRFKYVLAFSFLSLVCLDAGAQADRKEVRSGNRQFAKGNWQNSEIDYRKALVRDSASFAASYNLAGSLYRQDNFEEAGKALGKLGEVAPKSVNAADYYYNLGNVACQKKDWSGAVEAYKQSLLRRPGDMDAKENYAYAKLMLQKDGGGGGGGDGQNQDNQDNQNQDNQNQDNQDQNNQNKDNQNQDQNDQDNQDQGQGQGDAKISPQQAQQMLKAIQAREKETQDKVNREKAAVLKSRQKDKNW